MSCMKMNKYEDENMTMKINVIRGTVNVKYGHEKDKIPEKISSA